MAIWPSSWVWPLLNTPVMSPPLPIVKVTSVPDEKPSVWPLSWDVPWYWVIAAMSIGSDTGDTAPFVTARLAGEPVAPAKVPSLLKVRVPVDAVDVPGSAGSAAVAQSQALLAVLVNVTLTEWRTPSESNTLRVVEAVAPTGAEASRLPVSVEAEVGSA